MIGTDTIIDLSHWNASVDFVKLKATGVIGVIHKCTQGVSMDPQYAPRRVQAEAVGLLWGAYHFGTGRASAQQQAQAFLEAAGERTNLLLALDFEPNDLTQMNLQQSCEFIDGVRAEIGRYPVIYGGSLLRESPGIEQTELPNCPLWLSQYAVAPVVPRGWTDWKLWQYTDGKSALFAPGPYDRSTFNGTADELLAWWGK